MGTLTRTVGLALFVVFVTVIALRPLMTNPTVSAALSDGIVSYQTLLVVPLILVSVLIVVLRLRSQPQKADHEHFSVEESTKASFWDERDADSRTQTTENTPLGERESLDQEPSVPEAEPSTAEETSVEGESPTATVEDSTLDGATSEESTDPSQELPDILAGQGGTRRKDFEIESEAPEARLQDHLDHLQVELGEDETLASDLEQFRELAEEEAEGAIPDRCPGEHCNAVWAGRTILGFGEGRYEVLEDGRICCLECETVTSLE